MYFLYHIMSFIIDRQLPFMQIEIIFIDQLLQLLHHSVGGILMWFDNRLCSLIKC